MSEQLRITFHAPDDDAMREQVAAWLRLSGYHVERVQTPPPVSVGELAAMVGRKVGSVSRSLRRFDCPLGEVVYGRGEKRRRIIKLVPHEKLIAWLKVPQSDT